MSAIYCAQNIQYFEQIYHLHLIIIVGSISLLVALLFYLHYGSHHYHMGIDLERLELQNHCPVKYIWVCYFPQVHIHRFDFSRFSNCTTPGKGSPVYFCLWLMQFALWLVLYLPQFQYQ